MCHYKTLHVSWLMRIHTVTWKQIITQIHSNLKAAFTHWTDCCWRVLASPANMLPLILLQINIITPTFRKEITTTCAKHEVAPTRNSMMLQDPHPTQTDILDLEQKLRTQLTTLYDHKKIPNNIIIHSTYTEWVNLYIALYMMKQSYTSYTH